MDLNVATTANNLNDEIRSVLRFMYGDSYEDFSNTTTSLNTFICAATNDRVKAWNHIIQKLNQNPSFTFYSSNVFVDVDDQYGYLKDMFKMNEVNDSLDNPDVPNHTLTLKVGDICLLTANLSKSNGLAKNTKVKIASLNERTKHKIGVQVVNGFDNQVIFIPRIKFMFTSQHKCSFRMVRTQFPLRLAYCLTYNRSQGQTADKVVLDVVNPPFSHGQFYVATTRTRLYKNTMIYGSTVQRLDNGNIVVPNITHKEVLIDK